MRLRVSSVARLFGSPVSESLFARNSARARLRRLAQDRRCLCYRVPDPHLLVAGERTVVPDEYRADDLAPHQERLTRRARPAVAELAAQQRRSGGVLAVGAAEAQRQARSRLGSG